MPSPIYDINTIIPQSGRRIREDGQIANFAGAYNIADDTFNVKTVPLTPTTSAYNSAATTNATSVKNTAGTVFCIAASNVSASARYLKIYNEASAPVVGTDTPILTVVLAATSTIALVLGSQGIRLTNGIAFAITGAAADTDTTAIVAGEVKTTVTYI